MESTAVSDKSLGLSVLFGALGVVAALAMFLTSLGHDLLGSGIAYGVAMLAGAMSIAAIHIYG
jgi:hypothetical protein